ncbi:DUF6234 family protein [Streptomyces phaeoluteigriseus]|uniref:DUF6234 family protein n=1 Tax=Streptomyces phaeoluteigriseus TaxID=114686 RepID=A0ABY4ZCB1_9ACTN|nr:DUF6234 family protein [Streptomyces phaeoluteigriseus]USQ86575.1 DUF6234 family protein [Streptomyces phaeoluteigriseus]
MTTAPASPSPPSSRPHPMADVLVALVLLALDALAALVGVLWGLSEAGFDLFGSDDNSSVSFTPAGVCLLVLGLLVLGTAFLASRGRAYITACLQGVAGILLVLTAAYGLLQQYSENRPPAPSPGYSGPQSQCRSGGDNSECHG